MTLRRSLFVWAAALWLAAPVFSYAAAADFRCEALDVEGTVTVTDSEGAPRALKAGDLLKPGDVLEAGAESYADLAYDRDWQNVARLEANSKVRIAAIVPGRLSLEAGGVFATLKKLPQDSSFEVKTPTAVATVRGTEYRTTFLEGQTDVFNASSSQIVVYGLAPDGSVDKDNSVILEQDRKTSVETAGKVPAPPVEMSSGEKSTVKQASRGIETRVKAAQKEGRSANIQTVAEIETLIREEKRQAQGSINESELSRVTDTRRRAFGGGERTMAPPEKEPAPQEPRKPSEESPTAKDA